MTEIQNILCKSQLNLQDSMKLIAQKATSLTTFLMYYQCATFQEVLAPRVDYYCWRQKQRKDLMFEVSLF